MLDEHDILGFLGGVGLVATLGAAPAWADPGGPSGPSRVEPSAAASLARSVGRGAVEAYSTAALDRATLVAREASRCDAPLTPQERRRCQSMLSVADRRCAAAAEMLRTELAGAPDRISELADAESPLVLGGGSRALVEAVSRDASAVSARGRAVCLCDRARASSGPLGFFAFTCNPIASCMVPLEDGRLLADPIEGLSAKIEMLTGRPLPAAALEPPDPFYALDFSAAPELDAIVLSTLEFRNDFTGNLMAQALAHHARRGARVHLLVAASPLGGFLKPEDDVLLRRLEVVSPTLSVVRWKHGVSGGSLGDRIHGLHRVLHVKALVALSASRPDANAVILGGRNVKDTFTLQSAPSLETYPGLARYGPDFAHYEDLEILARGRPLAEAVAAHLLDFVSQRHPGFWPTATDIKAPACPPGSGWDTALLDKLRERPTARLVLSSPRADKRSLERLMVDLVASARREILIVSPYLRPTSRIRKALRDAARRGVRIRLVSRYTLGHDRTPVIVRRYNEDAFNQLLDHVEVFAWNGDSILHTKAISVDGELLLLGGINLNRRSFLHDIEAGLLLTGPQHLAAMRELFDSHYLAQSRAVRERTRVALPYRLLFRLLDGLGVI